MAKQSVTTSIFELIFGTRGGRRPATAAPASPPAPQPTPVSVAPSAPQPGPTPAPPPAPEPVAVAPSEPQPAPEPISVSPTPIEPAPEPVNVAPPQPLEPPPALVEPPSAPEPVNVAPPQPAEPPAPVEASPAPTESSPVEPPPTQVEASPSEPAAPEPAPVLAEPAPPPSGIVEVDDPEPVTHEDKNQLSEHFTLLEFTFSQTARERGIDNSPTPEILERLKRTAAQMERVRDLLGGKRIIITSGYRNPEVNRLVGGTANSDHMNGYCIDFKCPDFGTPFQIAEKIRQSPIMENVDQVIHEFARWVHISFDPVNRRQPLTAHYVFEDGKRKTKYLPTIVALKEDGTLQA